MSTSQALLTFRVGYTSSRPVRPDEHTAWVQLLAEDTAAGFVQARVTAAHMVSASGRPLVEMVTSVELEDAEL